MIQRFIRGSIASAHTLELTAQDLKAIQDANNRSGKMGWFSWTACSERWDNKSQGVVAHFFWKEVKKRKNKLGKKKEREKKSGAEKQASS